jgi:Protein of unknown function (DUF1631)
MQALTPYAAKADFRHDKLVVELLRICIGSVSTAMPNLPDEDYQELLLHYRDAIGERTVHDRVSNAKIMLDQHLGGFRHLYSNVLGTCLMSQLDKLQGREAAWPTMDNEAPGLVPDSVIERRMAIDEVTRLISLDAEEGVAIFDSLLCHVLGRKSTTLRENPLRPAVFFHAIGVCWARASGSNEHELVIIRKFGSLMAKPIAQAYPAMTKALRAGLSLPKPPSANMLMRKESSNGSTYERLANKELTAVVTPTVHATSAKPQLAALKALQWVSRHFDTVLTDQAICSSLRLAIAGLQMPVLKLLLNDIALIDRPPGPLQLLVQDLSDAKAWRRIAHRGDQANAIEMHLAVIQELLNREQSNSARSSLMVEHLRKQLMLLVVEPEMQAA